MSNHHLRARFLMSRIRRPHFRLVATLCVAFISALALSSRSEADAAPERFALLIANWEYALNVGRLRSPPDDADKLKSALAKLDFKPQHIFTLNNTSADQLRQGVRSFAATLSGAPKGAIALVYFAGHGAANLAGADYLIPINVQDASDPSMWANSYPVDELIKTLADQAPESERILVIDACRNNLAINAVLETQKGFRGRHANDLPAGTLLSYSTQPGRSALDDGRYARALSDQLIVAGASVPAIFMGLRASIANDTKGNQEPWHVEQLRENIMLAGARFSTEPALKFEATGSLSVVFKSNNTLLFSRPDPQSGLLEIRSRGSVHSISDGGGHIYTVSEKGVIKWIAFQTDFGVAYVRSEDVALQ